MTTIAALRRYLPIEQAALWCGLSSESLRRLVRRGRLKAHRPLGRRPALIDLEELRGVIEANDEAAQPSKEN